MSHLVEKPSAAPPWHCDPNYVVCQHGHVVRYARTEYVADLRRLSGHAFLACLKCQPSSYFFAVFSTSPDPHVTCYALSDKCFREWEALGDTTTLSTREMLYLLRDPQGRSFNPSWKPIR